jgi:signal transduction histidine kinase
LSDATDTEALRREIARLTELAEANARELGQERETLMRLDEVARQIASERELQSLVQTATDAVTALSGAKYGAFFYRVSDAHGESYSLYTIAGAPREAFGRFATTFDARGPVRIADITKDARFGKGSPPRGVPDGSLTVRSYLAVPVVTRSGVVLGRMFAGHPDAEIFSERSQRVATAIAAHAATAMDNARLHADSQRLIAELAKTNIELDQFAYVASHDLRAPLRGISNLAMWIEEDLGAQTPKKVAEQLALLKGRAARMDRLINGLLELARVGRTRQQSERVDITELLHETIDLASPSPQARVLIIGAMPTLNAERIAMQQVLLNLITNALQHAGRNDVVVRITATERPDDVEIVVADNGVGIAPEHHERVWEMFQTLGTRDQETTGIGLSIVKKQVEANGGRAWIDASAKEGATLRFTWPKRGR